MSARRVFIPPSGATCKDCGAKLGFYKNERGNTVPCNPDGTDHWDLCRDRRYALAKQGKHINNRREEAYYGPKGRFAVRESAYGKKKSLPACRGCVLPWEEPCAECPAAFRKAA